MKSCWSFLFFGFAVQAFAAAPLYHRQTERLQASQIGSRTLGDWLPNNKTAIQHWVNTKASEAKRHHNGTLEPVIQDFKLAIESDPALSRYADQMFVEVPNKYKAPYNETPHKDPEYHVDPTLVVDNACESAPLQVRHNASLFDYFFLKEQPYSLTNMLNFHPLANTFVGGIVYQAYLSTLSYHRWHAPFSGRIVHIENVPGTYYSGNLFTGLAETAYTGQAPDDSAPNYSQPYISAVATRGIVYIQARNPAIGLMAIVFVGMGEVSSCEFTVHVGQEVNKGDQLGMFHFGGSTHVMVFQPGVELDFVNPIPHGDVASGSFLSETNFAVRSALAVVRT
ncbi:hypothetical protein KC332_g11633 [Hortaea werneckii]|nr:hypothetical protein KC358_g6893 [Hortaea werneckii]KAI6835767.1 hypothetical protein KC350_g6437 [Hortaea werneckii]KAI6931192.1 hypothetical protein KC348_g7348 [Hortaea werneckii]KAI6935722.1 hypothetical protein KC341_g6713 [Hortaea werneckii]KAI6970581.1 hypothetical protein KC321_g7235 [Hortaea werneckii]